MTADGTSGAITFRSNAVSPAPMDWYGIIFKSTNAGSTIKYTTVNHAYRGISLDQVSTPSIANNTITGNRTGVFGTQAGNVQITNNSLNSNTIAGLYLINNSGGTIEGNAISSNGEYGVILETNTSPTMKRNTISSNGSSAGVSLYSYASPTIRSTTISSNQGQEGMRITYSSSPVMKAGAGEKGNSISGNLGPELHLKSGSQPNLDVGHNDIFDGTDYLVLVNTQYGGLKIQATYNWWGGYPPSSSRFSPPDSVIYSPADPNSNGAGAGKLVMTWDIREMLDEALAGEERDRYSAAARGYRQVMAAAPGSVEAGVALNRLFHTYLKAGWSLSELRQHLEGIAEQYPGESLGKIAAYLVLQCWVEEGQPAKALAAYEGVLAGKPDPIDAAHALFQIGNLSLYALNDRNKARTTFDRIALEYPGSDEDLLAQFMREDLEIGATYGQVPMAVAIPGAVAMTDPEASLELQSVPNPSNPQITLMFVLPRSGEATLVIYNTLGQVVRTLVDHDRFAAGRQRVVWDGRDSAGREAPSGTYFARLSAGATTGVRKLLLLK